VTNEDEGNTVHKLQNRSHLKNMFIPIWSEYLDSRRKFYMAFLEVFLNVHT